MAEHGADWDPRAVKAQRKAGGDTLTVATYAFDAAGRRIKKVVYKLGDLNGTEYLYYNGQQCVEVRDGSESVLREYPCP